MHDFFRHSDVCVVMNQTDLAPSVCSALLDLCHLKNVTYVVKKPDVAEGSEESESAEPETRKILGYVMFALSAKL